MTTATLLYCVALSSSATGDETQRPLVGFSVKADGAARSDTHWLAFSPDGNNLIIRHADGGAADATLALYSPTTGERVAAAAIQGGGHGVSGRPVGAVSPDGSWVVYVEAGKLALLAVPPRRPDFPGGGSVDLVMGRLNPSDSVWLDRTGESALVYRGGDARALERWHLKDNVRDRIFAGPALGCPVAAVVLDVRTGRAAISTAPGPDREAAIECWTIEDKPKQTVIPLAVTAESLALSPDGKAVAAGGRDGSVGWYDTTTGQAVRRPIPVGRFMVGAVAYHPKGRHLVCGTFDRDAPNLIVVDTTTGEVVTRIEADPKGVGAVCFSRDGSRLATAGVSGVVRVWDANALLKLGQD